VAEELLHAEGFTKVQYVKAKGMQHGMNLLKSGQLDLSLHFSARQMLGADTGDRSVILAGLHAGCFTLLGSERINSVRDLKGKTVWAGPFKMAGPHLFFSSIMAYVGLDPRKDINYAWGSPAEAMRLFTEGEIDAFMSFAPGPEELRAKKIGRVLVDTNVDGGREPGVHQKESGSDETGPARAP
jgi:NitT/TauT family transport system substrate-binding protein